jgi:hypothetical protein
MSFTRQSRSLLIAVLALSTLGVHCDSIEQPPGSTTTCDTRIAQIAVWDGFLQVLCGCGGTNGRIIDAKSPLTCTYALGTTLYVHFHGPGLFHQLVPVGTPAIPATSIYDPNKPLENRVFPVYVQAAGTYSFRDQFMGAELFGTLTVTP